VRLRQRFSRKLATSRRFVFENVFDLDHVCVVHRKWFSDLRIRTWRPDLVEYRLTSRFYGLRQEVEVRGAPIDADRYWYEFNGPLARIRVDGEIVGPDGAITLTEAITFEFATWLAPLFFALRPLFQRQKLDILRDDSSMLERVLQLDRAGFRRHELDEPRIVVFGGAGIFGRFVVKDLLERTRARIAIASRDPRDFGIGSSGGRVRFHICDARDRKATRALLRGARVAVNCTGPFQGMPLDLLESCIAERVHYVDVADDRDFVERACGRAHEFEAAGILAFVGCSVVPGLSTLLTERCREELGAIDEVRVAITPGTGFTRGPGSFACLLATVGEEYEAWRDGEARRIRGWTEPETIDFPPPIGRREVYSVVDIADYWTQRRLFGARTVEFKIGSEFRWLNRALALVREAKRLTGVRNLAPLIPLFRAALSLAARVGTTKGGVMVTATRRGSGPAARTLKLSAFREYDGHVIPALLPAIATQRLLAGSFATESPGSRGIADLRRWISFDELVGELAARCVSVARHDGSWRVVGTAPVANQALGS
jgi:hypothetical protein